MAFYIGQRSPKASAFLRCNRLKGCELLYDLLGFAFRTADFFLLVIGYFHGEAERLLAVIADKLIGRHATTPLQISIFGIALIANSLVGKLPNAAQLRQDRRGPAEGVTATADSSG
jgi:hypothetical protein